MPVTGIDISHWQNTTPPLSATISFVFARATYGTSRDGMYSVHAANTRAAGRVLGAYHFGRSGQSVRVDDQVTAFLAVARTADLWALDLEADAGHPTMSAAEASHFIAECKRRGGKTPGLYHSLSGFPLRLGQAWNWVAKWSANPPNIPWAFWQYTSEGGCAPGWSARLDCNRFNGTLAELHALAGPTPQQGDDMAIQAPDGLTSAYRIDVHAGADFFADGECTKKLGTLEAAAKGRVYVGKPVGELTRAVVLVTGTPYESGEPDHTVVYVRNADASTPYRVNDATPYSEADLATAKRAGYDLARTGLQLDWPPRP